MELVLSLNSPSSCAISTPSLPSWGWGRASSMPQKPSTTSSSFAQPIAFPPNKRHPPATNTSPLLHRPRSSVSTQVATVSSSKTADATEQKTGSKDNDLVFVAGATGRVGSRTIRELLKLGFRVRAGVRSAQRAEALLQSVREMKLDSVTGSLETQPVEKLEVVECDLENKSTIAPAIGSSSVVICCIGASEKEVFDITGPYRIDYKATKNLIEAATVAEVEHFILVSSLGTNKFGLPAAVLNLFWGVLCWKRKAEEALISSGIPYTIVRPGGMERPTDSYKETHNIVLANEDTYFGGNVSNLQVAELMAFMAKNRRLAFCKVVEVIAETTTPLTPMEELLAKIPPQRELPAEPNPDPIPLKVESERTSLVPEKEVDDVTVPKANSQSPFTMYADLKPPTSPTPAPSIRPARPEQKVEDPIHTSVETTTSSTETEPNNEFTQKAKPLSPYIAYEDLKPPTSPSPTPSIASMSLDNGPASAASLLGSSTGNNVGVTSPLNVNEKELPENLSHQSPYNVYDGLKPPTSPTPSTPSSESESESFTFTFTSGVDNSATEESSAQNHIKLSRPLSPYTMYKELKPPSSPIPSAPKY